MLAELGQAGYPRARALSHISVIVFHSNDRFNYFANRRSRLRINRSEVKLLTRNTDIVHLHVLKNLLEANGIPAAIKGENTARMVSPFLMTEPSLWVFLDEQWEEAEKLIIDPDYRVDGGIDVDEFYRVTRDVAQNPRQLYDRLLLWAVVASVVMIAVIVLTATLK